MKNLRLWNFFSIQRTCYKTLMQEVQEKEVANQDPSDLVASRQPSTVLRVSERLALLKNVFVRTRTPRQAGIIDRPYRNSNFIHQSISSIFFFSHFRWIRLFSRRKWCCPSRSINSKL